MSDSTHSERTQRETNDAKVTTTLKGSMGERITKALQKVEDKKKKRAARRAMVILFYYLKLFWKKTHLNLLIQVIDVLW